MSGTPFRARTLRVWQLRIVHQGTPPRETDRESCLLVSVCPNPETVFLSLSNSVDELLQSKFEGKCRSPYVCRRTPKIV